MEKCLRKDEFVEKLSPLKRVVLGNLGKSRNPSGKLWFKGVDFSSNDSPRGIFIGLEVSLDKGVVVSDGFMLKIVDNRILV